MEKGLSVEIYRWNLGDCSNKGLSSRVNKCTLVGKNIPKIFEVKEDAPAVQIVERNLNSGLYLTAYPVKEDGTVDNNCMFGGTFIYTSDSRFPARYPVPLHDRKE
jgi:hypothetical protein